MEYLISMVSGTKMMVGIPNIFKDQNAIGSKMPLEVPFNERDLSEYCEEGAKLLMSISQLAPVIRLEIASPHVLEITICSGCNLKDAIDGVKQVFSSWNFKPKTSNKKPVFHQTHF